MSIIDTSDPLTLALRRVINRAARKVLEARTWSFDIYDDGQTTLYAPIEKTESSIAAGDTTLTVSGTSAEKDLIVGSAARILVSAEASDTSTFNFLKTAYRVTEASHSGGTITMTIDPGFLESGTKTSPTLKIFSNSQALPATVRRVVSVRHLERPLQLEFVERHIDFDRMLPRQTDSFRDPEVAYVGSTVTNTQETGQSLVKRVGMMVWPPPSDKTELEYSFVRRHPTLTNATDELEGVPPHIEDLVVDRAHLYCLTSSIQNDIERAREVRADFRADMKNAMEEDEPALRRRLPRAPRIRHRFGDPWRRWDSRQIPAP